MVDINALSTYLADIPLRCSLCQIFEAKSLIKDLALSSIIWKRAGYVKEISHVQIIGRISYPCCLRTLSYCMALHSSYHFCFTSVVAYPISAHIPTLGDFSCPFTLMPWIVLLWTVADALFFPRLTLCDNVHVSRSALNNRYSVGIDFLSNIRVADLSIEHFSVYRL
jgi:hypothetical protein